MRLYLDYLHVEQPPRRHPCSVPLQMTIPKPGRLPRTWPTRSTSASSWQAVSRRRRSRADATEPNSRPCLAMRRSRMRMPARRPTEKGMQRETGTSTARHDGPRDLEVGFGAWAIGGEWAHGWGPQDDAVSIAAIRHAVDLGVNWIDTAAIYGLGHSEEVVGRALHDIPIDNRPFIFTKGGVVPDPAQPSDEPVRNLSLI